MYQNNVEKSLNLFELSNTIREYFSRVREPFDDEVNTAEVYSRATFP